MSDREPWWKCRVGLRRSDKLAALPSDSARLGWVYVLCESKLQRRLGVFVSRVHFGDVMGRYVRYLNDYIAAGLAHESPALCDRCKASYPEAADGEIVIHDYRREQRDPTNADRQADYRGSGRNGQGNAKVTPKVTPKVTASSVTVGPPSRAGAGTSAGGCAPHARAGETGAPESALLSVDVTANVTPASRARGTTETETERISTPTPLGAVDARPAGESEEPRLTRAQLDAWATFTEPAWEPFKAAWLGRGLLLPPFGNPDDDADTSQRARLWRIADDQPEALGRWVREAKGKTARDVIAYVFAQRAKVAERAESDELAIEVEHDERLKAPVPADWFERPKA